MTPELPPIGAIVRHTTTYPDGVTSVITGRVSDHDVMPRLFHIGEGGSCFIADTHDRAGEYSVTWEDITPPTPAEHPIGSIARAERRSSDGKSWSELVFHSNRGWCAVGSRKRRYDWADLCRHSTPVRMVPETGQVSPDIIPQAPAPDPAARTLEAISSIVASTGLGYHPDPKDGVLRLAHAFERTRKIAADSDRDHRAMDAEVTRLAAELTQVRAGHLEQRAALARELHRARKALHQIRTEAYLDDFGGIGSIGQICRLADGALAGLDRAAANPVTADQLLADAGQILADAVKPSYCGECGSERAFGVITHANSCPNRPTTTGEACAGFAQGGMVTGDQLLTVAEGERTACAHPQFRVGIDFANPVTVTLYNTATGETIPVPLHASSEGDPSFSVFANPLL
jgi:hypothetical protein